MKKPRPQACSHTDLSNRENYVLYGVSRKGKGFGFQVARQLEMKGITFTIVHPEAEHIGSWIPVRHVKDLPSTPDAAILCSPKRRSMEILAELAEAGVRRVYASWGAVDQAGWALARERGLDLCEDCPLLHVDGLGFPHNLHRWWVSRRSRGACQAQHAAASGSP